MRSNGRTLAPAVAAVLLLTASACGSYRRTAPVNLMDLGPAGTLRQIAENAGVALPMRVRATLQLRFEGGSMTGQAAVLFAEPDSVRLDVTAFLGSTVLQALITGGHAMVYAPSEKVVLEGDLLPGRLVYVGGYPFDLASVREWILGPAITRDWSAMLDRIDRFDLGVSELTIGTTTQGGSRIVVRMDSQLRIRSLLQIDAGGGVLWETAYDDYDRVKGNLYPGRISVRYPDAGTELSITVNRRTVNPDRARGDFLLPIPTGTQRVRLQGAGPPPPEGR